MIDRPCKWYAKRSNTTTNALLASTTVRVEGSCVLRGSIQSPATLQILLRYECATGANAQIRRLRVRRCSRTNSCCVTCCKWNGKPPIQQCTTSNVWTTKRFQRARQFNKFRSTRHTEHCVKWPPDAVTHFKRGDRKPTGNDAYYATTTWELTVTRSCRRCKKSDKRWYHWPARVRGKSYNPSCGHSTGRKVCSEMAWIRKWVLTAKQLEDVPINCDIGNSHWESWKINLRAQPLQGMKYGSIVYGRRKHFQNFSHTSNGSCTRPAPHSKILKRSIFMQFHVVQGWTIRFCKRRAQYTTIRLDHRPTGLHCTISISKSELYFVVKNNGITVTAVRQSRTSGIITSFFSGDVLV